MMNLLRKEKTGPGIFIVTAPRPPEIPAPNVDEGIQEDIDRNIQNSINDLRAEDFRKRGVDLIALERERQLAGGVGLIGSIAGGVEAFFGKKEFAGKVFASFSKGLTKFGKRAGLVGTVISSSLIGRAFLQGKSTEAQILIGGIAFGLVVSAPISLPTAFVVGVAAFAGGFVASGRVEAFLRRESKKVRTVKF